MDGNQASGFRVTIGTEEEGRRMIGSHGEPWQGEIEVNLPMIRYYCASVRDGNPSYWDEAFAQRQWGGAISPPAMLASWLLPLGWHPHPQPEFEPLAMKVPLPGSSPVNISTDTEFFQPVRVGDRLTFSEQLVDISAEKKPTAWGSDTSSPQSASIAISTGCFWPARPTCSSDSPHMRSTVERTSEYDTSSTLLAGREGRRRPANSDHADEPERRRRKGLHGRALRPLLCTHAQGQPDIYFNTLFHQSMVDRVISAWAGPACFLARRKGAMRGSIHAGDCLSGDGRVARRYLDDAGRHCLDLEIILSVGERVCCDASATLVLPESATQPLRIWQMRSACKRLEPRTHQSAINGTEHEQDRLR